MDLLHLVDRLEELVGSAQKMPIGSRAIVDRRRILDIVDQMRVAVPQEVRDAQEMVTQRDELYREAEEEARLIIARAEERASRMVEQHELTIAARARAEEVAQQAEARIEERLAEANAEIQQRIQDSRQVADQQMEAADEYARELLIRLETQLQAFVRSVQSGIQQLHAPSRPAEASAVPGEAGDDDQAADETAETVTEDWSEGALGEQGPDELGDLLQATSAASAEEEAPPPAEPGVIDDFAMAQFDDEPSVAGVRSGGEEQSEAGDESTEEPRP
jgi:hypothetical protein